MIEGNVANLLEKSKADEYARKLKKYNPLFPEQYQNDNFTKWTLLYKEKIDKVSGKRGILYDKMQ